MKNLTTVLEKFTKQLEMSKKIIISHNYVIQVGAYTIGLNSDKTVDYRNSLEFPSQWNEGGVKNVKKALLEMGDDREVKAVFYKDFYRESIETIKRVIELEKLILINQ